MSLPRPDRRASGGPWSSFRPPSQGQKVARPDQPRCRAFPPPTRQLSQPIGDIVRKCRKNVSMAKFVDMQFLGARLPARKSVMPEMPSSIGSHHARNSARRRSGSAISNRRRADQSLAVGGSRRYSARAAPRHRPSDNSHRRESARLRSSDASAVLRSRQLRRCTTPGRKADLSRLQSASANTRLCRPLSACRDHGRK